MEELKLVMWRLSADQVPQNPGLKILDIDFAGSIPELLDHLGAGYEIINHSFVGTNDGGAMLTLFLRKAIVVPNDPAGA